MSSSSSSTQDHTRTARVATRPQLADRANQLAACFVLDEYSDDPDTSARMVGEHVPLVGEATEQVPLTPTASATVDTKDTATFDARVMDDNDEIWTIEVDHNGIQRSRAERIVACCSSYL